jgi:hypothetical protein
MQGLRGDVERISQPKQIWVYQDLHSGSFHFSTEAKNDLKLKLVNHLVEYSSFKEVELEYRAEKLKADAHKRQVLMLASAVSGNRQLPIAVVRALWDLSLTVCPHCDRTNVSGVTVTKAMEHMLAQQQEIDRLTRQLNGN